MEEKEAWDVFIAYAGKDANIATEIYNTLIKNNYKVFIDTELPKWEKYNIAIPRAQKASKVTLVIVTDNYDETYFEHDEIDFGIALERENKGHTIMPIYIENKNKKAYGLLTKPGILIKNKNYDLVTKELDKLFKITRILDSSENNEKKQKEEYEYNLHNYPRTAFMNSNAIDIKLLRFIAGSIDPYEANDIISQANQLRKDADSDNKVRLIDVTSLPNIHIVGSLNFWRQVINYARLNSARMFAALIITIINIYEFDNDIAVEFNNLLRLLRNEKN